MARRVLAITGLDASLSSSQSRLWRTSIWASQNEQGEGKYQRTATVITDDGT